MTVFFGSLGVMALVLAVLLGVIGKSLRVAAVAAVVAGATLPGGWITSTFRTFMRVITGWLGQPSDRVLIGWAVDGAVLGGFAWSWLHSPGRTTVLIGLFVPVAVAAVPGQAHDVGLTIMAYLGDFADQIQSQVGLS